VLDRKRFRSGSVRTWFTTSGPLPNPEPDFGFGSGLVPNFEPDRSPVQKGSGPNRGSEPDPGITTSYCPVDGRYDTLIDYATQWPQYWLVPLLNNENFDNDNTLIVLSFDKNELYTENNCILTLFLEAQSPTARGTHDLTYDIHYSLLSTVEVNWGLESLDCGDTKKCVFCCCFSLVRPPHISPRPAGPSQTSSPSSLTDHANTNVSSSNIPANATGAIPGPARPRTIRALHRAEYIRYRYLLQADPPLSYPA